MALTITTASLPQGAYGASYTTTLQATGGTLPYTWSIMAGTPLPAGLTLDPVTGVISGTPVVSSFVDFIVVVTDAVSATDSKGFDITATYGPDLTPGVPFSFELTQDYIAALMTRYQPFTTQNGPYDIYMHFTGLNPTHDGTWWGAGILLNGWNSWLTMTEPSPGPDYVGGIGGLISGTPPSGLDSFNIGIQIVIVDSTNTGFTFAGSLNAAILYHVAQPRESLARYRPIFRG